MKSTIALLAAMVVGGTAVTLNPRGPNAAGQIRLAYHGDEGMMVSWNTFEHVAGPSVRWGLSRDNLDNTASSETSVTYPTSTTYNNHVLVAGLQPDTTYYYLPSPLPQGNHEPYSFKTARPAGDAQPFSVAVVIDLGTMGRLGLTDHAGKGARPENVLKPGEKNTIDSLASTAGGWDFMLHPGDIAYADYWLKEEIAGFLPNTSIADGHIVYEAILNDFYDEMAVVTESKPYMVGPGNHEANCDNGGTTDKARNITYDVSICSPGQTNFTGFKNHFRMPSDVSGGTGNFWYSFDHGMTHFVQLDTETDLGHGFVGPDEVGGDGGEGATPLRVFEPLFLQHGVDLYLSGHAHVYERMAPLADGAVDERELQDPKAPWYITNGAAGHYDGLDDLLPKRQAYSRFALDVSNATYGWSRLTFHNCTHMTHEFVASNNNSVLDTATLFKDRKCDLRKGGHGNGNGTTGGHHPNGTATHTATTCTAATATSSATTSFKGASATHSGVAVSPSGVAVTPSGVVVSPSGSATASPKAPNATHSGVTVPPSSSGARAAASVTVLALAALFACL
ncbi:metallophosphoesterase [Cordyceps fumosorosea ARSEF 2679]|uniref:Purple acid phosphatase n=1 Tax=Cordyceps fumosorosea (strain ARSEF 2679) TaxID=1081104 RepID=A0A167VXE9_CORFA|nr:metallophosphoesterase [Cordyceps fumosorosea ARSEF 2679]OAA63085.1 metallophosphoesterase [Cordyceps fumosorosea ARSEF 2679]